MTLTTSRLGKIIIHRLVLLSLGTNYNKKFHSLLHVFHCIRFLVRVGVRENTIITVFVQLFDHFLNMHVLSGILQIIVKR